MGIPGLSTFIVDRSDYYLRPHKLKDSRLVIDGDNACAFLYRERTRTVSAFGGDYDLYCHTVRSFFNLLQQCNVTPIVIFDGGHDEKKLCTVQRRNYEKVLMLKNYQKRCWKGVFLPLLLRSAMHEVVEELGVNYIKCFFEADSEIAAVAKYFNCPVLSHDSDYFIYDALYIPFTTLSFYATKEEESNTGCEFYIDCCLYDVNLFVSKFEGLDKSLLPLVPAILGNDYVDYGIFKKFLAHVALPNMKVSLRHKTIYAILLWLQNQSIESAKKAILSHLPKKLAGKASQIIDETVNQYKRCKCPVSLLLNGDIEYHKNCDFKYHDIVFKLPDKFIKLFQRDKLSSFLMDIMHLNRYYVPLQVEDVRRFSSHEISFPIIHGILKILNSFIDKSNGLHLYLKNKTNYEGHELPIFNCQYFAGVNVKNIMNEPVSVRTDLFYDILDLTESDREILTYFNNSDWILFIISTIFWMKNSKQTLSSTHVYSLVFMAIANFVQSHVGYFKNALSFMKEKARILNTLSKEKIAKHEFGNFSELLSSIHEVEYLSFTRKYIKLRKAEDEVTEKGYLISAIHLFASFQSCLFHIWQLSVLLDYPHNAFRVGEFYSGTLLYNIYYVLNRKSKPSVYIENTLKETPNLLNLYSYLTEKLSGYVPGTVVRENPTRPGGWKKKKPRRKRH